jgi:hypothetical protein
MVGKYSVECAPRGPRNRVVGILAILDGLQYSFSKKFLGFLDLIIGFLRQS